MAPKRKTGVRKRVGKHPLQELREALGKERAEFAESIGRTRPFVAMVEDYEGTDLGRETVLAIFDLYRDALNRLGITAEDLLRGTRERAVLKDDPPEKRAVPTAGSVVGTPEAA